MSDEKRQSNSDPQRPDDPNKTIRLTDLFEDDEVTLPPPSVPPRPIQTPRPQHSPDEQDTPPAPIRTSHPQQLPLTPLRPPHPMRM